MIVQCTNCRARFRVADEKVPERGVKVRCTKCTTVFRVTKADAVDGKPGGSRDPFGLGSDSNTPTPLPGATGPQRRSGGHDAIDLTGPIVGQTGPQLKETSPTIMSGAPRLANFPQSVSLTYGAASPHQTLDLDLSLGPPSASQTMAKLTPAAPMKGVRSPPTPPAPAQSVSNALDAALSAAMGIPDPFADALGPPPTPQPRQYAPPAPMDPFADVGQGSPYGGQQQSAATVAFNDPFAVDFGAAAQPHMGGPPMPTIPDPFGGGFGQPPPYARPPPLAQPQMRPPDPPPADPWANLLGSPPKEETDPFSSLDASPPPPPEPRKEAAPPPAPERKQPEPKPEAGPGGDGGLRVTGSGEFEMEATRGHKLDLDYGPGREMEGFRPPEPKKKDKEKEKDREEKDKRDTPGREVVDLGRIQLGKLDGIEPEDKLKVAEQKALARAKLRREIASGVFSVACAFIVLYCGIVAVAWARTPRPIGFDDLGFPMVWLALGSDSKDAGDQLRALQVRTGIYPTRGGGELFYVEGVARNGSAVKQDALYAQIEIRNGDRLIEQKEALAQLKATPEHLWLLDSRKNDDLQKMLVAETATLEVESHREGPFIAVFKLTAKDVEGSDVKVTVHAGIPPSLRAALNIAPKGGEKPPEGEKAPEPGSPEPTPEGSQAQKQ